MSSSKISLHDCSLSIRLPILSHTTPEQSSEKIALHAAATPTLDHSEAYTGSTILVLLTISLPHVTSEPPHFLQHVCNPHVYLIPDVPSVSDASPTANGATRLPVLTESLWRVPSGRGNALIKAVWALVRAPPERGGSPLSGKHELVVELRERLGSTAKNSPVWATIDRASRLFGRTSALRARKPLLVVSPIDLTCSAIITGSSVDRPIVRVVVRNATADASVAVAAPHINLASSRRVSRRAAVTLVEPHPAIAALDRMFEPVPLFDVPTSSDRLRRSSASSGSSDHGIPLPNFDASAPPATVLRPHEVFAFALRIDRRVSPDADSPANSMVPAVSCTTEGFLVPGDAVQTNVSVAWSCTRPTDACMPDSPPLRRELSAGGVLATGKRAAVAVLATTVEWRPAPFLHGVIISVSGPATVRIGVTAFINITVANCTSDPYDTATVVLQLEDSKPSLLALRTAISIGKLNASSEAQVQVPCVALHAGTVRLGTVSVICQGNTNEAPCTWTTENEFKTIAVDQIGENSEGQTNEKLLQSMVVR